MHDPIARAFSLDFLQFIIKLYVRITFCDHVIIKVESGVLTYTRNHKHTQKERERFGFRKTLTQHVLRLEFKLVPPHQAFQHRGCICKLFENLITQACLVKQFATLHYRSISSVLVLTKM